MTVPLIHLSFPKAFDAIGKVHLMAKHAWPCHVEGLLTVLLPDVPSMPTFAIPVESCPQLKVQHSVELGQLSQCQEDQVVFYQWQFQR